MSHHNRVGKVGCGAGQILTLGTRQQKAKEEREKLEPGALQCLASQQGWAASAFLG